MWVPVAVMAGLPANCYTLLYFTFTLHFLLVRSIPSPRLVFHSHISYFPSKIQQRIWESTLAFTVSPQHQSWHWISCINCVKLLSYLSVLSENGDGSQLLPLSSEIHRRNLITCPFVTTSSPCPVHTPETSLVVVPWCAGVPRFY